MNLIETRAVYLPAAVFEAKGVANLDARFGQFARLCSAAAQRAGVYDVKGHAVRLREGQLVATLEDLAKLWQVTKRSAERSLDAFVKDGLIDAPHVTNHPEILVDGELGFPPGSLISVRNYRSTTPVRPQVREQA